MPVTIAVASSTSSLAGMAGLAIAGGSTAPTYTPAGPFSSGGTGKTYNGTGVQKTYGATATTPAASQYLAGATGGTYRSTGTGGGYVSH